VLLPPQTQTHQLEDKRSCNAKKLFPAFIRTKGFNRLSRIAKQRTSVHTSNSPSWHKMVTQINRYVLFLIINHQSCLCKKRRSCSILHSAFQVTNVPNHTRLGTLFQTLFPALFSQNHVECFSHIHPIVSLRIPIYPIPYRSKCSR